MKRFCQFIILTIALTTAFCSRRPVMSSRAFGNRLNLAYVVLYEHEAQLGPEKQKISDRLELFSEIIQRESRGHLNITCKPVYIPVGSLSSKHLNYQDHSFFEWMDRLLKTNALTGDYEIVTFTPVIRMPWAHDCHSIGYYYKNRVCFSLEYHTYTQQENVKAVSLMIHKMLHGFGYNHQNINMPALKLLNWQLGLPVNTGLEFILREKHGTDAFFFSPHLLSVLNTSRISDRDSLCLDCGGLFSQSDPWRQGITADAYGPYCYDADHDGILDHADDYFLSSPVQGTDTDEDGITDSLDRVPWNQIRVSGNIKSGKIHLIAKQDRSTIAFESEQADIIALRKIYLQRVPVQVKPDHFPGCFPQNAAETIQSNRIVLEKNVKKPPVIRIEVVYRYMGRIFYRPFYFFFTGTPVLQIINEREWIYFLRFGADIPAGIDFYQVDTYDANHDGFLDPTDYQYFSIPESYDWDGDGFPDFEDTLPTVYGSFQNQWVSGVKDSDGDGLADPGCLDFSSPAGLIPHQQYFGELNRVLGLNPDYDLSPYLAGSKAARGMPDD
ncbi:hypothetical protein JW835_00925 [bacterium]|nr:hypothetical protein [bacterium]